MSNPFRKTSALKRLLSILVLVAFSFSFSPVAMAQGEFDFTDDDESGMSMGDFDFSDDAPTQKLDLDKKFVMPNNGKPVNLVFFEPVDGTPQKTLDRLTEATLEQLKGEHYSAYDSVEAVPVLEKLGSMDADARMTCVDDAACLADIGHDVGAANIIVGRIYTENREQPQITFDIIDVSTSTNKNSIYFDTQSRLRKQEQDISGALLRLFNIDTGSIDTLLTKREEVKSAPLPLGQLVSGIVLGVVALGAIGTGIYFGLEANNYDDKVSKAIDANKDQTKKFGEMSTQLQAKDDYDKASNYAMIANILYASGAVLAVVSAILFLVRSDKDEDIFANELYVSPTLSGECGGVVAGFSF